MSKETYLTQVQKPWNESILRDSLAEFRRKWAEFKERQDVREGS